MESFSLKTRILSGAGALSFLKTLNAKRIFLVTDPYFVKSGMAEKVLQEAQGEASEIFGEVQPDPSAELAAAGTARFQAFSPDLLIALGGGSAMDCAKAISYFSKKKVPFAAVPTTSGSGSEVTDFAILTHDGIKHPLVDETIQPDYAILDPELLSSLPRSLIADAGFDVLSHALEAVAAKGAGVFSDLLAKEAFRLAYQNLPASFSGDLRARLPVHQAAAMAGGAFNQAGLGLCHAMSHSLGGMFHVPHGRLNAILLPSVLKINGKVCAHGYGELARAAGLSGAADSVAVRNLSNGLVRLRRQLQLPATLREAGVDGNAVFRQLGKITEAVLKDSCSDSNPVPVTGEVVRQVLSEVTGGV